MWEQEFKYKSCKEKFPTPSFDAENRLEFKARAVWGPVLEQLSTERKFKSRAATSAASPLSVTLSQCSMPSTEHENFVVKQCKKHVAE